MRQERGGRGAGSYGDLTGTERKWSGGGDHVDGDGENESLVFDKNAAGKPLVMTIVRH